MFPLWDPGQLLSTSLTLLLKVATLQLGDEGSGSDEATSVTSEGDNGPKWVGERECVCVCVGDEVCGS